MTNLVVTPTAEGATGRIYLLQMGMKGPGSIERHGGYEDVYVKTPQRLAHQVAHPRAQQGVARAGAADGGSELKDR